jgi:hypothetical protein
MIRYRCDQENSTVVAVECVVVGYPHLDVDGEKQYENSHFDKESDAWDCLLANCEAGVSLDSHSRRDLIASLEHRTKALADSADRLVLAKENREKAMAKK